MKMLVLCYEKCSTCKAALKWLTKNGLEYESRDIKGPPTYEELEQWNEKSGVRSFWSE